MFVVWALTGMWHGAFWNFILWGLYYFVFLVLEKYVFKLDRIVKPVRHLLTLVIVLFGWVLFKFSDMGMLGMALKSMFGLNHNSFHNMSSGLTFQNYWFFLIISIVACTPVASQIGNVLKNLSRRSVTGLQLYGALDIAVPLVLMILSTMALAGNSYNPFLYFQF